MAFHLTKLNMSCDHSRGNSIILDPEDLPGLLVVSTPLPKELCLYDVCIYDIYKDVKVFEHKNKSSFSVGDSYPCNRNYVKKSRRLKFTDGLDIKFFDIISVCTCGQSQECICDERYAVTEVSRIPHIAQINRNPIHYMLLNRNTFLVCVIASGIEYERPHYFCFARDKTGEGFKQKLFMIENKLFSISERTSIDISGSRIYYVLDDIISITDKDSCVLWNIKEFRGQLTDRRKILTLPSTICKSIESLSDLPGQQKMICVGGSYNCRTRYATDHVMDYKFEIESDCLIVTSYGVFTKNVLGYGHHQPRTMSYYRIDYIGDDFSDEIISSTNYSGYECT